MTGHNSTHGYRYTMLSATNSGALHEDRELGAIDAPRNIPAGSHLAPWYFDGPCYSVINRTSGCASNIHDTEWRNK